MGPLYKFGQFDVLYGLQLAGLIGFFFGFALERAGFGNPRKLTAIFYFRDFAVLKVMFTAIVVCILGLLYFSIFGWIDLGRVYILPTYIWPQIVGGVVLGVGFVMGGYCPTTSVVASVSGKLDGMVFVLGMIGGSFLFAEVFPLLKDFYSAGQMGVIRLPDVLKINSGMIALLVCLMAVGAFWMVEKVEQKFGDKATLPVGNKTVKRSAAAVLILLGLIVAIVNPDSISAKAPSPAAETRHAAGEMQETITEPSAKNMDEVQNTVSVKPPAAGFTFKIVDDEGC